MRRFLSNYFDLLLFLCLLTRYRRRCWCVGDDRLTARGLTYNNNSGQLSIEYLRPDPTSQFSKRSYPTVRQLRQHVASLVHLETTATSPGCEGVIRPNCRRPKPDNIPTFTGSVNYAYNDVAKVILETFVNPLRTH